MITSILDMKHARGYQKWPFGGFRQSFRHRFRLGLFCGASLSLSFLPLSLSGAAAFAVGDCGGAFVSAGTLVTVSGTAAQGDSLEAASALVKVGDYSPAIDMVRRLEAANTDNMNYYIRAADIYLKASKGEEAVNAVIKARLLGANYNRTAIALAKGYLIQQKYQQVLETLKDIKFLDTELYEAAVIRGDAFLSLGKRSDAEMMYRQAVQTDDTQHQAYIGLSRMALQVSAAADAEAYALIALEKAPSETMVHYTLGLVQRFRGKFNAARGHFDKAIALFPANSLARLERASILINQNQIAAAEKDLDVVYGYSPKNQMAFYLSAVIEVRRGNIDQANELLNRANQLVRRYLPATYVRGLVSFEKGHYALAETFLKMVLNAKPNNGQVRKTLATAQLRQRKFRQAYQLLKPFVLTAQGRADPVALNLTGIALMGLGKYPEGTVLFEKAVKLGGDRVKYGDNDPIKDIEGKLALARYAAGRVDEAIEAFEKGASSGGSREQALLAAVYIREGYFNKAEKVASGLIRDFPTRGIGYNLLGTIQLEQQDYDAAIQSFEKALSLNSNYLAAAKNIAISLLAKGAYEEAANRLKGLVEQNANDYGLKALFARTLMKQGRYKDAAAYFRVALRGLKNVPMVEADFAESLLRSGRANEATQIALNSSKKAGNDPDVLAKIASVLLETGQAYRATQLTTKIVAYRPTDIASQTLHGRAQMQAKLFAGARNSFSRVQSMAAAQKKDVAGLPWYQAELEVMSGRIDRAEILLPSLKIEDRPAEVSPALRGEILYRLGQYKEAVDDLSKSLDAFKKEQEKAPAGTGMKEKAYPLYALLADSYNAQDQDIDAVRVLTEWLTEDPANIQARIKLATLYERQGQDGRAVKTYRDIFEMGIVNADISARLARLLLDKNDFEAGAMATYAFETKPQDPYVINSYGLYLLKEKKQYEAALKQFQTANSRAPGVAETHYFIGLAYQGMGMPDKVRTAYEAALKLSDDFKGAEKAKRYLDRYR